MKCVRKVYLLILPFFTLGCVKEPPLLEKILIFTEPNVERHLKIATRGTEFNLDVEELNSSNIVIASNTKYSFSDNTDVLVTSVDTSGNIESSFLYGGTNVDQCRKIVANDNKKDYLVLLSSNSLFFTPLKFAGANSMLFRSVGLFLNSNLELGRAYEYRPFGLDFLGGIGFDGNYWITGTDGNQRLIFGGMNKNGKINFVKSYFPGYGRYVFPVKTGFFVVGVHVPDSRRDVGLLSLTSSGEVNWGKTYPVFDDSVLTASVYNEGALWIISGSEDGKQILVMKLDQFGEVLLSKKYLLTRPVRIFHMQPDGDNMILSGASISPGSAVGLRVWISQQGDVVGSTLFNKFQVQTLDRTICIGDAYIGVGLIDENASGHANLYISAYKKQNLAQVSDFVLSAETVAIVPRQISVSANVTDVDCREIPIGQVQNKRIR